MLEIMVAAANERDGSRTDIELGEQREDIMHNNKVKTDDEKPSNIDDILHTRVKNEEQISQSQTKMGCIKINTPEISQDILGIPKICVNN